jgi:hypothetical protein
METVLSGLIEKAHKRSLEMARSNQGLNKSTNHLREVNKQAVLYGFCMDEMEAVVNHPVLGGSLEEVRDALGIPEGTDLVLLADLLRKKALATNMALDFRAMLFQDQQQCQIIQVKSLEYMTSYKGNAGLHEATIRRIETTDRGNARATALVAKETKKTLDAAKPAGGGKAAANYNKPPGGKKPYQNMKAGVRNAVTG